MNKQRLRRRLVVDWRLQGSLCAHGLLYGVLIIVVISGGIFLPLLWNLGDATNLANLEEQAIVLLYMHDRFWLLAAFCVAVVALGAIKLSHRIAGPLVRYKRNLSLLAEGRLPPALRTRTGDYLQAEVACLNAAVAGVATRVEAIARAERVVRRELLALRAVLPRESGAALAALAAAGRELELAVAAFRAVDPGDDRLPEHLSAPVPQLAGVGEE